MRYISSLLIAAFAVAPVLSTSCNISNAVLSLPANQTALPPPSGSPKFITLAFGTQNYTCDSTGKYVSAGAVAVVLDMSCGYKTPLFPGISARAFKFWNTTSLTYQQIVNALHVPGGAYLGEHIFIPNPITGTGISPIWDFRRAFPNNPEAYIVGARGGGIASPDTKNIDWLWIKNIKGGLAKEVYRVETQGGQPPSSCVVGSGLYTVRYTSLYWLH